MLYSSLIGFERTNLSQVLEFAPNFHRSESSLVRLNHGFVGINSKTQLLVINSEARFRSTGNSCMICSGKHATGTGVFLRVLTFGEVTWKYHYSNGIHLFTYIRAIDTVPLATTVSRSSVSPQKEQYSVYD
jgi:S-adenosylmethionine:tRNA-ribosyltransferase-isomerase (queuine synthetase)